MVSYIKFLILLLVSSTAYSMGDQSELKIDVLSPRVRTYDLDHSLYSIQRDKILPLVDQILVLDSPNEYHSLPYVLGFDHNESIGSNGSKLYVKRITSKSISSYYFIKPGKILKNPATGENLGFEVLVSGEAVVEKLGATTHMQAISATSPIIKGERVIPRSPTNLPNEIKVKKINRDMKGYVVSIGKAIWDVGNSSVILVSLGKRDGVGAGDLLYIVDDNQHIRDPYTNKIESLPGSRIGELVILNPSSKVSTALVMNTSRAISVNDLVTTKDPS